MLSVEPAPAAATLAVAIGWIVVVACVIVGCTAVVDDVDTVVAEPPGGFGGWFESGHLDVLGPQYCTV